MATDTPNLTAVPENPSKTLDTTAKPDRVKDSATNKSTTVDSGKDGDGSKTSKITTSAVSDTEKKIRRAERFGITVQLSEQEKRNSRAERFGTVSTMPASNGSKHSEELKRKARAERFGLPQQSVPSDENAKKKARLERFGPDTKTEGMEDDKRKARALRFSQPVASSLSVNGKGNIGPAAITGNAGGGS